jgi:hypothetical protein
MRPSAHAMKYLLATAAVLALTSVSATASERYQPNEAIFAPPAEYDKPFIGKLEEVVAKDQDELIFFCGKHSKLGCAWPSPFEPSCIIYLASDELIRKSGYTPEFVRRHEIAHCNGWNHPLVPDRSPKIDPWSLKVSKP